jgi:hypothetical protein
MKDKLFGLMLPGLFVLAWVLALTSSTAPGASTGDTATISDLRWMLYFSGYVLIVSSAMHSVFARTTARSIGWKTNGFQYELASVSLGLGIGCFYAINHDLQAMTAVSIPIITFLFLAGVNHVREIIRDKNYAPNNTLILIWDFGISISLGALLLAAS